MWRQLWRVLERSDVVVQVVDSRDPLLYRSVDLELYAKDIHATKKSLLVLNKADLLPPAVRSAWADYFDAQGVSYMFYSAFKVRQRAGDSLFYSAFPGFLALLRCTCLVEDAGLVCRGGAFFFAWQLGLRPWHSC